MSRIVEIECLISAIEWTGRTKKLVLGHHVYPFEMAELDPDQTPIAATRTVHNRRDIIRWQESSGRFFQYSCSLNDIDPFETVRARELALLGSHKNIPLVLRLQAIDDLEDADDKSFLNRVRRPNALAIAAQREKFLPHLSQFWLLDDEVYMECPEPILIIQDDQGPKLTALYNFFGSFAGLAIEVLPITADQSLRRLEEQLQRRIEISEFGDFDCQLPHVFRQDLTEERLALMAYRFMREFFNPSWKPHQQNSAEFLGNLTDKDLEFLRDFRAWEPDVPDLDYALSDHHACGQLAEFGIRLASISADSGLHFIFQRNGGLHLLRQSLAEALGPCGPDKAFTTNPQASS